MKNVSSVFGKFIISAMLVTGLAACNSNQRSDEVRVKQRNNGTEEVKVKKDVDNDSVHIDRDATIRREKDGDTKVKENTKVDLDKDRGDVNDNNTRNR
jgi:hypothetical protein